MPHNFYFHNHEDEKIKPNLCKTDCRIVWSQILICCFILWRDYGAVHMLASAGRRWPNMKEIDLKLSLKYFSILVGWYSSRNFWLVRKAFFPHHFNGDFMVRDEFVWTFFYSCVIHKKSLCDVPSFCVKDVFNWRRFEDRISQNIFGCKMQKWAISKKD